MEKLVIFADYGLDDAAATATIFKNHERFDSITVIPIGGNVPERISYRNCYTILSHYPELLYKVSVVSTENEQQPSRYLADIHGNDGMGDVIDHPSDQPTVSETTFEDWSKTVTGDEIILSLGPLTLVKKHLEKHACKQLVIMGGVVKTEPNYNGYEFNQALDVEAFSYCTRLPHTVITLDTCRTEKLDMRRITVTGDDLHSRVLKADQVLSVSRKEDGCYVWDDVAACYLLFPERFKVTSVTDPYGNRVNNAEYISNKLYFEN
ncbi:MAG: nucleoside hydrolase [Clostridia bacterium]|nr:nucleoside hydrolase [Clostridia bacterium]